MLDEVVWLAHYIEACRLIPTDGTICFKSDKLAQLEPHDREESSQTATQAGEKVQGRRGGESGGHKAVGWQWPFMVQVRLSSLMLSWVTRNYLLLLPKKKNTNLRP
jgi:hypothetical protein